ncbi:hypothetical protein ANCDUO_13642 [Ancylostoma duodenale]|uniref:Uncharacterized protein n=1 Tax=Ancylostoma duodenale TaxID=51022 RepID=A0A0C2CIF6_9BILA|nr:hypothetical protein ANCDUO_13642 [Ancylostoma duodenale]
MHTDPMSEIYQRKVNKAKKAIEEANTAKSIVKYLREYNALKHQLFYQPSDPPGTPYRRSRPPVVAVICRSSREKFSVVKAFSVPFPPYFPESLSQKFSSFAPSSTHD